MAAITNDRTTAGPAIDLATTPAKMYTPHPKVEPIPSAVKSNKVNTRFSFSLPNSCESVFFLVNAQLNESVCKQKNKNEKCILINRKLVHEIP